MGDYVAGAAGLELDDLFAGPLVYVPDMSEPETEEPAWLGMAERAMGAQSASSSASQ